MAKRTGPPRGEPSQDLNDADRYRAACADAAIAVRRAQELAAEAGRWKRTRAELVRNAHADLLDAHRRLGELLADNAGVAS